MHVCNIKFSSLSFFLSFFLETLQYSSGSDELALEFVSTTENNNAFDIQVSQLPGPCDYESTSNRTGTYDDLEKNILY